MSTRGFILTGRLLFGGTAGARPLPPMLALTGRLDCCTARFAIGGIGGGGARDLRPGRGTAGFGGARRLLGDRAGIGGGGDKVFAGIGGAGDLKVLAGSGGDVFGGIGGAGAGA